MHHLARRTSLVGRQPEALRRRSREAEREGGGGGGGGGCWRGGGVVKRIFHHSTGREIIQRGNQRKWRHNIPALHNLHRFKHNA